MINIRKRFCIIFSVLVIIALIIPISVSANEKVIYPNSINGYPVIFKATSENTFGLNPGETILTVFIKDLTLDEEFIFNVRTSICEYLNKNPLPKGYKLKLYGGPGASEGLFQQTHKKNCEYRKIHGTTQGVIIDEELYRPKSLKTYYEYTFAAILNTDPNYGTVTFQSAYWYAPTVGESQDPGTQGAALLVNGATNTGYVLQTGQGFGVDGVGTNVWTDSSHGLVRQDFDVEYNDGDNCKFAMGKYSEGWFVSCTNYTTYEYDEYLQDEATGTYLVVNSIGTSVFLENWNTNSDWYDGFSQYGSSSGYLKVRYAKEVKGGTYCNWAHETKVGVDNTGTWYYDANQDIISGSLVNLQNAYWDLEEVFLAY